MIMILLAQMRQSDEWIPKEILIAFHNGSNYDYHFTIQKVVGEFEGQLLV